MNKNPTVSVLLPNLNNRQFLEERLESILSQTMDDLELVIADSYSDDGAWELFQDYAKRDSRIRLFQIPREGIYPGWNRTIPLAKGELIYIATSDDTMEPTCLEKMVAALREHPECDVCHCCLQVINEKGEEIPNWWRVTSVGRFFGELMDQPHIRMAPYDGVLHFGVYTVYFSITQLLMRRQVFDTVGLFKNNWGSHGDFEWGMRVGLMCNVIHVPEALASWRIHSNQASSGYKHDAKQLTRICEMVDSAFSEFTKKEQCHHLNRNHLVFPYQRNRLALMFTESPSLIKKISALFSFAFKEPICFLRSILLKLKLGTLSKFNSHDYIKKQLDLLNLKEHLKILIS